MEEPSLPYTIRYTKGYFIAWAVVALAISLFFAGEAVYSSDSQSVKMMDFVVAVVAMIVVLYLLLNLLLFANKTAIILEEKGFTYISRKIYGRNEIFVYWGDIYSVEYYHYTSKSSNVSELKVKIKRKTGITQSIMAHFLKQQKMTQGHY